MFPERRDDDHPGDRRRSISNRAKLGWMHRTERDTRRDVINGIRTPLKGRRSSFVIVSIALYIRVNSFPMFVTMELIIKLVRINRRERERERELLLARNSRSSLPRTGFLVCAPFPLPSSTIYHDVAEEDRPTRWKLT